MEQEKTKESKKEAKTIAGFTRESKLGWKRKEPKESEKEAKTIACFTRESKLGWRIDWTGGSRANRNT